MPPTDDNKPAPAQKQQASPDRTYRVIKGQYGPWPLGSVFSDREFKRIHAIPKNDIADAQIDRDTYHGDLLGRAIALGVVELAPNAQATSTPPGPEAATVAKSNETIRASTDRVIQQRASDQAAATVPEQPAAPLHTGLAPAPVTHGGTQPAPVAPAHPATPPAQ